MRALTKLLVILPYALLLNGCDKQQDEVTIDTWTWVDTTNEFKAIDITPGTTIDVILEVPDPPYEYAFRVITPKIIDEVNGNPLIVSLHGGVGGAGREAHKNTQCIEPALEDLNGFVISPNADKVQWYEIYNQRKISNILNLAISNWPIDFTRMVITGYSDGGNGTWFFSEVWPNVFSAGIAMASSYSTISSEGDARIIKTPMYVIHSSADELFPLEETQYWVDQTIAAGSDVKFVVADGLSHYAPCDYTDYFEDGIQWVMEEVWQ